MALLGTIFTCAVRKGIRLDNPVHGVVKFAEGRRHRRRQEAATPVLVVAVVAHMERVHTSCEFLADGD